MSSKLSLFPNVVLERIFLHLQSSDFTKMIGLYPELHAFMNEKYYIITDDISKINPNIPRHLYSSLDAATEHFNYFLVDFKGTILFEIYLISNYTEGNMTRLVDMMKKQSRCRISVYTGEDFETETNAGTETLNILIWSHIRFVKSIELINKGNPRYLGEVFKVTQLFKIPDLESLNIECHGFKRAIKTRTEDLKNITVEEVGNVVEPIELSRNAGICGILESNKATEDDYLTTSQTLILEYSDTFPHPTDFRAVFMMRTYVENAPVKSINLDVPNIKDISVDCPTEKLKLIMDNIYAPHLQTLKMKLLSLSSLDSEFEYIHAPTITKADICLYQQEEGTEISIREKFTFLRNAHELKLGKGCDQIIMKRDYNNLTTLHISDIYKKGLLEKSMFPKLQTLEHF